jgi:hypothetical protein
VALSRKARSVGRRRAVRLRPESTRGLVCCTFGTFGTFGTITPALRHIGSFAAVSGADLVRLVVRAAVLSEASRDLAPPTQPEPAHVLLAAVSHEQS